MWEQLDFYFGPKDRKDLEALEKFNRMPDIKVFNANTVAALNTALLHIWQILKETLRDNFSKEDNHLFHPFLRKLPSSEIEKYRTFCEAKGCSRTFRTFRDWLRNRYLALSDDKDHGKAKGPTDIRLQYWMQDVEVVESTFYENELSGPGDTLELTEDHVDFDFDSNGEPRLKLTDLQGEALLYYDKGKQRKIGQMRLPQQVLANAYAKHQRKPEGNKQPQRKQLALPAPKDNRPDTTCRFCKSRDHVVYKCPKFAEADLKKRLACVKEHGLCFRCLAGKHLAKDCKVRFFCNVDKCGKRHHKLLHTEVKSNTYFSHLSFQGIASDIEDSEDEL
jgi:hypothetical protein